jgi:uncharacterized protein (DUF302 family)
MTYHFTTATELSFDEAIDRVTAALKEEGFGIMTQINVQETLKNKLDVDFHRYQILGACNPAFAFKALQTENKIGTMLPCNVVVQQAPGSLVEVSAIDPLASMAAVENPALQEIATEIQGKLKKMIAAI